MNELMFTRALEWIGTPFRHQGRIKGESVDCAGLLIGVQREVFGTDWDFTSYREIATTDEARVWLEHFCDQVLDQAEAGDLMLFERYYRGAALPHMAIYGEGNLMVMASAQSGKVQVVSLDPKWVKRLVGVYRRREPGRES